MDNPPNNPNDFVDPVQAWVAQHEQRDSSGRFASTEHYKNSSPNIPTPISFTENNKYSEKTDPPLVSVSVTNPITYLKLFIKRLLRNEGITIKIKPLTAIAMILALSAAFGTGFNVAKVFFPNSSPILHRSITLQGVVEKSQSGQFYLSLPDGSLWTLKPIPPISLSSLTSLINKNVLIKGNMTAEANVIEVSEVFSSTPRSPLGEVGSTPRSFPSEVGPNPPIATTSAQPN